MGRFPCEWGFSLFAKPVLLTMLSAMNLNDLAFWMTILGTICWGVCFWWMHRISTNQNDLLAELRRQTQRIEKLSREEHELIKEVHPQVGEIKQGVEEMVAAVKESAGAKL